MENPHEIPATDFPVPAPSPPRVEEKPPRRRRTWPYVVGGILFLTASVLFLAWVTAYSGGFHYTEPKNARFATAGELLPSKTVAKMEKSLKGLLPKGPYVVVDSIENKFFLRKGDEVLLETLCSAGTGAELVDPKTGKKWVFESPRGLHKVREKKEDPVWTKPDWAFFEEGEEIPKNWSERIDKETLGEYALYLGKGYMIHGTLYTRYLGRSITHGCIRLGDEDLELVYKTCPLGTMVYIY